jgi:hypothetical protein
MREVKKRAESQKKTEGKKIIKMQITETKNNITSVQCKCLWL